MPPLCDAVVVQMHEMKVVDQFEHNHESDGAS
jgi:hypothetical protein